MASRSSSTGPFGSEVTPDLGMIAFLYELGEIAASGGAIRARLFVEPSGEKFIL